MGYELKPFDDKWKICFRIEKDLLLQKLTPFDVFNIEHIGATSALLCDTLGTIDILVSLNDYSDLITVKNFLNVRGYEAIEKACTPNCMFLVRRNEKNDIVATIRIVANGSKSYLKLQAFSEYLKQNKNNALRYNAFRKELLAQCGDNLKAYARIKGNFIESVLEEHCKFE